MWPPSTSVTHNNSLRTATATATATAVNIRLPPQRCLVSFAFSAKSRCPENCYHDTAVKVDWRQNSVGVVGKAVDPTAFKSKAQQHQKLKPSSSSSGVRVQRPGSNKREGNQPEKTAKQESEKGAGGERRRLSGSDVLWALQRASAEKAKKYQQQQQKRYNANQQEEEMKRVLEVEDDQRNKASTTSAVPHRLCIQSKWGARLEELENRLEELIMFIKNV